MADQQILNEMPQEIKDMPQGAQNVFVTAFQSAQGDGMDHDAAMKVAWNTISHDYRKNDQGQWVYKAEESNQHKKAVTAAGN